jgi:CRISPR-associated protein Csd1
MLLQALYDFYQRAARDGLIEEAAFTQKYVRWIIPLDADGNLEGVGLIENPEPKKDGRIFSLPRSSRPKNAGGVAEFLWDGLEAIFCLPPDLEAVELDEKKRDRQTANRQAKHEDFWRQISEAFAETNNPAVQSVIKFREQHLPSHSFLRWGKSDESAGDETPCWWVKTSTGKEEKFKADNFTFQVNGEILLDNEIARAHWRKAFMCEREQSEESSEKGLCIVTGQSDVPISSSHLPKISNVPGATSTGAALVSFDKDSFTSYGFDKSYNSPVSIPAVEAYCNSLNFLLSNNKHRLKIGNTALCFWAKESEEATDLFAELFEKPKVETVRHFLVKPFKGERDFAPLEHDQFYSVTLSGNAGRVVVRHWMQTTVEQAVKNFQKWFEDLNIVTLGQFKESEDYPPLSLFRLAVTTVREAKDLRSEIAAQLYRAALEGHAPSLVLAKQILDRLSADLAKNGLSALNNLSRFALLRLIVNRNRKEGEPMIEPIITDTDDAAYNCGRLLAIFDDLQMAAHDYKLEGAGVVERYYGSASSSPNSAFGILWRLHQHHLKKLGREKQAKAEAIKKKIEEIASRFKQSSPRKPPQFPRSFNLQEQGRFALGFYQQKATERRERQAYLDAKKEEQQSTENQNNETKGGSDNE